MDSKLKSESSPIARSNAPARLSGSWLVVARSVWLVLVVPSLGLFVAGLPILYRQIQMPCVDTVTCNFVGALTARGLQELPALGFSISGYAAFITIFFATIAAIWSGIGFLLFWRRSDDWFALVAAFFLVMFNITYPGFAASVLAYVYPALNVPITIITALGQISIGVFLLLFPNGRFVPRWMVLFLLPSIIQDGSSAFPPASPFNSNNWPIWLIAPVTLVVYGAIIFSQIYRYRRMSTAVERQQTKWVILGIITVVTGLIALEIIFNGLFPTLNSSNTPSSVFVSLVFPALLLLLPLSIGIAILRYRLYDIDVLINRTLVYTLLTGMLALVYFGSVFVFQTLLRQFTGQTGQLPLVTVASTLLIAALFQPLRHRIQGIIDHRFYRRKYDAKRTLEAFSAKLREEVDLNTLSEHLLGVVEETMQPRNVSLWLCKTDRKKDLES